MNFEEKEKVLFYFPSDLDINVNPCLEKELLEEFIPLSENLMSLKLR